MSTISNERLEEMRDYDTCVRLDESAAMATELLALRKERERAEPVHDPDSCDPDVFERGISACLVDIPNDAAEIICRGISAATGCMIDWHYVGGRVHIKALRTAPPAPPVADDPLPYDPQIDEYEQIMEAELKAAARTAYKVKSELSQMAEKLVRDTTALALTLSAETDTTSQQFESLAGKAAVPPGWKLVPIEPTVEMQIAFAEAWFSKVRCVDDCELEDAYIAMLAVAPEPCK